MHRFFTPSICACAARWEGADGSNAAFEVLGAPNPDFSRNSAHCCWQVTHAISYPGPVLSMGISPDCTTLAAGLATGLLAVKRHAKPPAAAAARTAGTIVGAARARRRAPLTAANYKYFLRGQSAPAGADDYRVRARRRVRLAPFDRALRKFLYRDALDAALGSAKPEVVASVLQELTARSGLNAALGVRQRLPPRLFSRPEHPICLLMSSLAIGHIPSAASS